MTSISHLSNWQPAIRYAPATTGRNTNPIAAGIDASVSSPASTIVTLSPEAIAAAAPVSTSQRYKDLGADMLRQLGAGAAVPPDRAKLLATVDNRFTLSVTTQGGGQVDLTLANVNDEMIFQISSSAELNDDERKALSDLADAFQAAIDGIAGTSPQVKLGALTQFDPRFVQSIAFHAEVAGPNSTSQTLDFQIDDVKRKVSIGGPDGRFEVNVDASSLEHLGSKQKQEKAINSYLTQFDQAVSRGHGDKQLMSMFKDAFSEMNRTAIAEVREDPFGTPSRWKLNADDRSALTGLSDFSAALTQAPQSSNPRKPQEEDTFSYDVSQATKISGPSNDDRRIGQTQQAHLGAKFHTAIAKSSPPFFDGTPQTQNYEYHRIDDSADSDVSLNYRHGKLVTASLAQMASQSEHVQTFFLNKLKSEKTMPSQQSLVRDLLPSLTSFDHLKGEDTVKDNMLLLGAPGEIATRSQQF